MRFLNRYLSFLYIVYNYSCHFVNLLHLTGHQTHKLKPNLNYINKVILCGGGANLNNIRELASSFFKSNVRIGRPIGLIDLPEIVQTPSFACLTGLLIKSLEKEKNLNLKEMERGILKYFGKLGNWFDQNI